MKPLIKRFLLQKYVTSQQVLMSRTYLSLYSLQLSGRLIPGCAPSQQVLMSRTYLSLYSLQLSGRLIPGCAHNAQNMAIDPDRGSLFSSYPNPNRLCEISARHCWLTLSSSQYQPYFC